MRIFKLYIVCVLFVFTVIGKNVVPNKSQKLAIISTWNIKCGIAVYTKNIVDALQKKNLYPVIYSNTFVLTDLLRKIKKDRITSLNIQYKDGLYPNFNDLLLVLKYAKKKKIMIVLTLHGIPPAILLKYADKVIFHKKIDNLSLRKAKKYFIPMGTPVFMPQYSMHDTRLKYGFSIDDKIAVTSGFMFSAKQHASILKEMAPYLKQSPRNKVQLLTAFNDTALDECQKEFENIRDVIKRYGLEDHVIHITDFISQQELSERIWLSDIGYLWMDSNTHETSAATKEFIAGRTPLIVNDSNHFHDITTGVVKTPFDKTAYVKTIFEVLNGTQLDVLKTEMKALYEKTNYMNLIDTYIQVYYR